MEVTGTPEVEQAFMGEVQELGSSSVECELVILDRVAEVWPHVEPYLRFIEGDEPKLYTTFDLRSYIEEGRMHLWTSINAERYLFAFVTQFVNYPHARILDVVALGGEALDRWLHLLRVVELWARASGADYVRVIGRRGWERKLVPLGYVSSHVTYKSLKVEGEVT
jgi:hypothetical protein